MTPTTKQNFTNKFFSKRLKQIRFDCECETEQGGIFTKTKPGKRGPEIWWDKTKTKREVELSEDQHWEYCDAKQPQKQRQCE